MLKGVWRVVRRPKGLSYAESTYIGPYTGDGHQGFYLEYNVRYTFGKIEVAGGRNFWRGFAKRGVRPNRPNPPPLVTGLELDKYAKANQPPTISHRFFLMQTYAFKKQ